MKTLFFTIFLTFYCSRTLHFFAHQHPHVGAISFECLGNKKSYWWPASHSRRWKKMLKRVNLADNSEVLNHSRQHLKKVEPAQGIQHYSTLLLDHNELPRLENIETYSSLIKVHPPFPLLFFSRETRSRCSCRRRTTSWCVCTAWRASTRCVSSTCRTTTSSASRASRTWNTSPFWTWPATTSRASNTSTATASWRSWTCPTTPFRPYPTCPTWNRLALPLSFYRTRPLMRTVPRPTDSCGGCTCTPTASRRCSFATSFWRRRWRRWHWPTTSWPTSTRCRAWRTCCTWNGSRWPAIRASRRSTATIGPFSSTGWAVVFLETCKSSPSLC